MENPSSLIKSMDIAASNIESQRQIKGLMLNNLSRVCYVQNKHLRYKNSRLQFTVYFAKRFIWPTITLPRIPKEQTEERTRHEFSELHVRSVRNTILPRLVSAGPFTIFHPINISNVGVSSFRDRWKSFLA